MEFKIFLPLNALLMMVSAEPAVITRIFISGIYTGWQQIPPTAVYRRLVASVPSAVRQRLVPASAGVCAPYSHSIVAGGLLVMS